jgi:undecaprenyl-diphosphatase
MTLVLLLILASVSAGVVAAAMWRLSGATGPNVPSALDTARDVGRAIQRHPGPGAALARRLDPRAATGLALTLALVAIVVGGVLLGVLTYLVRGNGALVQLDESVANWGDRHASAFSTDGLEVISHLGEPLMVVALAVLLAVAETVRTRSVWVVPFLLIVVTGNGILTTTVKELVDRVRPALNPIAETLGPSFPSGHSSWSAAFFAAAALLLTRGRGRTVRVAIGGVAAWLIVMVAGSRVLLDVHWLSDVIAGLALGLAWFSMCAIAFGGRLLQFGSTADEVGRLAARRDVGAGQAASPAASGR